MNHPYRHKLFSTTVFCALLAALVLPANAFAQPKSPARWLLVFDLSSTMKKRLPATEEVVSNFFASGAEGRLQDGDNLGVWTYDKKLHAGQFPTAVWDAKQAVTLTTNLTAFLRSRTFTGDSQMAALQPALGNVITHSERLTIVIFCDGESEISATPYDRGINQSFLDGQTERKKSQQPFVVLIRTLSGKYIGCTVNFPPGTINIPLFLAPVPPAPATNPPAAMHITTTAKPAPVVVPDLVIIGTHLTGATNTTAQISAPTTNPLPDAIPKNLIAPATNPMPVMTITNSPPTNALAAIVIAPMDSAVTGTNAHGDSNQPARHRVFIGGGLLAAVVVGLLLIFRPGRRPQTSLISSSMQDNPRRK